MKLTKEDAALHQLSDAIDLYNAKRYVSTITLAGASEEILAQILALKSKETGIPTFDTENTDGALYEFSKDILDIKNYSWYRNNIKNELKHHGEEGNKDILSGNFKQIALNHIAGCIINYKKIHSQLPTELIIKQFCVKLGIS